VPIPGGPEIVAHSDGDVLLHALAEAVLGCFGGWDTASISRTRTRPSRV
jgi:2-C-methyl-D-erythritol 4-phosphate cytidylyltransferase/2-C-methyl-D-erythritol 2,4-cyclodiphosphate synthase